MALVPGGVPVEKSVGVGVVEVTAFHIGVGVGVPVDESVGASEEGKSYTGIKWIGSTLD